MPTYQYACTACGEQLEAVQTFTDAALTECPACQGTLRKVYSAVGVVFKGSGFYKNDSRSASKSESSGESKSDAKTDAKTASKPDAGGSSTKTDTSASKPAASTSTSTPAAKSA